MLMHGKYYGNNHTISGIYINNSAEYQGLFGFCTSAEIKDLGIINSYIKGENKVGGIVGYSPVNNDGYMAISNVYNNSIIMGVSDVGGVIGEGYKTTINNCYNLGYVSGNGSDIGGVGGNIKYVNITNSYNEGIVTGDSSSIGGVIGHYSVNSNDNTISNCYNDGFVNGKSYVGGVCGIADSGSSSILGNITKSYNIGNVIGNENVGGITGGNYCKITECYNAGDVSGDTIIGGITGNHRSQSTYTQYAYNVGRVSGDSDVGGIIGKLSQGSIYYSYNSGEIIANDANYGNAGGIAGDQGNLNYNATINSCYNLSSSIKTTGSGSWTYCGGIVGKTGYYAYLNNCYNSGNIVNSSAKSKGGIAGHIYNYENRFFYPSNCAYLKGSATSGTGNSYTPSSDTYKIKALSEEEMPDVLSVIGTSYFEEDTNNINNGYPILKWQVEEQE